MRKNKATTIVVGIQGEAVLADANALSVIGGTLRAEMTPESRALLASAPSLTEVMIIAGVQEQDWKWSDADRAESYEASDWRKSGHLLTVWGFLRG
jgi:hypothetical protein